MRWERVREIFRKDFLELRSNRSVFATLFILPVILTGESILTVTFRASSLSPGTAGASDTLLQSAGFGFDILLLIPLLTAVTIGATSIVQEKTNRSLEPLLATPITDTELLVGKALTPLLPGVIAVWACYVVEFIAIDAVAWPIVGGPIVPTALAAYQMLVLAPALGLLGTLAILVVSSWAKDSRAAQQMSTFVVLPVLVAVLVAFVFLPSTILVVGGFTVVLGLGIWFLARLAVRKFDRPSILISWR
jgi:ABC-type Na+ efflux pump permease subunit